MKAEYGMSHAYRTPFADNLPQLSLEHLRKLASGEATCISKKITHVCKDGEDYILKERNCRLGIDPFI